MNHPTAQAAVQQYALRHIVVAVDFSTSARDALRRGVSLAANAQARVSVIHAVASGVDPELAGVAADRLRMEVAAHASAGQIRAEIVRGRTAIEVAGYAERESADLVVVGAHGEHQMRDLLLGTTAEAIVELAPVPVLVVRGRADSYSTNLVAVDVAQEPERVIGAAGAVAPQARQMLVHVVSVIGENLLRMNGVTDDVLAELRDVQLATAKPRVARLAEDNAIAGAHVVVEPGRPQRVIPELTKRLAVGLVTVGTQRSGSLRHLVVGSVARHVLRDTQCDVLVVPLP